jgi:hypothetical protein
VQFAFVEQYVDVFSRTFLPATAEAGLSMATVTRHMHVMRRCVEPHDGAVLVTKCTRPDRPTGRDYLMVLTYRRLVVTQESRVLRQLRLHLNTELRHLGNVVWHPDQRMSAVVFAATAIDGVRERFLIKVANPKQVWHLDALLTHVFKPRSAAGMHRSVVAEPPHLISQFGAY